MLVEVDFQFTQIIINGGNLVNFLNNFQSELISQTSIVHYIEFQFEQELNKVRRYLNVEIKDEIYNNN